MVEPRRTRDMLTPVIPLVGELVAATPGTISFGQGVVSYGPPPEATAEIGRFLASAGNHKYKAVQGIPELCDLLSAKLRAENGLALPPQQSVVVTAGGNLAFVNAICAITDPGDEVILLSPYYFNHHMAVTMMGCRPVLVATDADYQPRVDAIAAAIGPRTRAVVTVSPNNPTGAVYPEATLRAINDLCRRRGVFHIHDEAYEYFTYGGVRPFSPGAIAGSLPYTISLHSLSKAYGFASWRIGYMVIPEDLLVPVKKVQDTILICPPVVSQFAACGAVRVGRAYCHPHVEALAAVRQIVLHELDAVRDICTVPPADGAFYLFIRVRTALPTMTLVERLIREHRVAVMPGTAFGVEDVKDVKDGQSDGTCAIRVSYGALEQATAAEGVGRLVRGLRAIVDGQT